MSININFLVSRRLFFFNLSGPYSPQLAAETWPRAEADTSQLATRKFIKSCGNAAMPKQSQKLEFFQSQHIRPDLIDSGNPVGTNDFCAGSGKNKVLSSFVYGSMTSHFFPFFRETEQNRRGFIPNFKNEKRKIPKNFFGTFMQSRTLTTISIRRIDTLGVQQTKITRFVCNYLTSNFFLGENKMINNRPNFSKIHQPSNPPSEKKRVEEQYKAELKEQICCLEDLHRMVKADQKLIVREFMDKIGELFLKFFINHPDLSKECAQEGSRVLEDSVSFIEDFYVFALESLLTTSFETNEWEIACNRRSNIEAFNVMFGQIICRNLETEEIDDLMRAKEEKVLPSDIPPLMPKSHWWWYHNLFE